ncbi:MAG: hypothetical protein ACI9UA_004848 [Pseudoalteromonas tetraodonis]|jgi:hypothetical protein
MKHLTLHERLLIVAVVALVLVGSIVRLCRALRDQPDPPKGIAIEHAAGTRTD